MVALGLKATKIFRVGAMRTIFARCGYDGQV